MGSSHFRLPNSSGTRPVISTNLTTEENVSELSIEGGEKARDRLRARSFLRLEENSSSCAVAKQRDASRSRVLSILGQRFLFVPS